MKETLLDGYMMREVKATTLAGQIEMHDRATAFELSDVYGRCSYQKEHAWNYCYNLYRKLQGWDFKIISFNTFQFSVGFYFYSTELHNICFAYITKAHDRFCQLYDYDDYIPAWAIKLMETDASLGIRNDQ